MPALCRRGAKFTKWRAALSVGGGRPSQKAIEINAEQLAAYAAISQVRSSVFLHYLPIVMIPSQY